ncbi:MAG: hypothetical protein WCK73_14390 [Deltaproteobacteria bacterium]
MNRKIFLSVAVLGLALSPLATLADDKPITVEPSTQKGMAAGGRAEQVTAKVTAIDAANRTVTLKGKNETDVIKVGPEVKNFDQIKVGDTVVVTVSQGFVFTMQAPGAKDVKPAVDVQADTAAKGQKPAGEAKAIIKATVTITKIDAKTRLVTMTGPEGRKFKVAAGPDIALEKLKVGDKVVAEYTEMVAVAVEPAPAKKAKKPAAK